MQNNKRRFLWIALLFAVLAVTAWGVVTDSAATAGDWVRVERQDLVIGVDLEGELRSVDSTQLGPPPVPRMWNFKIAWLAPEGSEVAEGQPVLRFDTNELQQRLQEEIAKRDQAEKNLEKVITDLEKERRGLELRLAEAEGAARRARLKLDVPVDITARRETEKSRIDLELAELEIASLESNLEHLEARTEVDIAGYRAKRDRAAARVAKLEGDIGAMTVKAPRAGTVIYVSDWRGQKYKVSDSVWRAAKVVEIPDLSRMMAEAEVAEADIGRAAVDQSVTLTLDAHPDHRYQGRIASIRRAVQTKSRHNPRKVVKIEVELESTDTERMRPGMRLRGTIETGRIENTLVVPEEAVFPRPEGTVIYLRTLTGEREVRPTFGERNRDAFEVLDGLEEGDRVLRRGATGENGP